MITSTDLVGNKCYQKSPIYTPIAHQMSTSPHLKFQFIHENRILLNFAETIWLLAEGTIPNQTFLPTANEAAGR